MGSSDGHGGPIGPKFVCVDCAWTGGGIAAAVHHVESGHAVRGRHWPADLGNARFPDADADGRNVEKMRKRA
jgi:hypothetical protein